MDLILDNTMLSSFHKCPTSFYWRHVRHLVLASGSNKKIEFGVGLHRALEAFYKGSTQLEAMAAFAKHFQPFEEADPYSLSGGVRILEGYFKKWLPEQWKVKHVEVPLQWELSSDLVYCGRVDLLVEQWGDLMVVDHKSSGSITSFCPQPNHQLSGYVYGGQVLGLGAKGAIVNLLAVLKTKEDYNRIISYRAPWELENWRDTVLSTKARIDRSLETGHFERYTTACSWCPYKLICNSPPEAVEPVIQMHYKESRWEPWKLTEEGAE